MADAVQEIQRDYVPTVVAIKTYQRDNGQLPTTLDDLVPRYLNVVPKGQYFSNGVLSCDSKLCRIDCMRYIITPDHEGWTYYSQFIRGDLKLPPVTLDPAPTQPITPQ